MILWAFAVAAVMLDSVEQALAFCRRAAAWRPGSALLGIWKAVAVHRTGTGSSVAHELAELEAAWPGRPYASALCSVLVANGIAPTD